MKALLLLLFLSVSLQAAPGPLVKGGFRLVDVREGKIVTQAAYAGKVQLVFFGFTHCRLTCPTGLGRMAGILEALGKDADKVAPLFITTDPERDTPALMAEYAGAFSPRIVPLHGSKRALAAAMRAHRVEAEKVEEASDGSYQMDHPAMFFVMDRQGRFLETLPSGGDVKDLTRRLRKHL